MSKWIGKRVSYPCTYCGKQFSWNSKCSYIEDVDGDTDYYCKDCTKFIDVVFKEVIKAESKPTTNSTGKKPKEEQNNEQ